MHTRAITSLFTIAGGTVFSFGSLVSLATVFAPEIMMAM